MIKAYFTTAGTTIHVKIGRAASPKYTRQLLCTSNKIDGKI